MKKSSRAIFVITGFLLAQILLEGCVSSPQQNISESADSSGDLQLLQHPSLLQLKTYIPAWNNSFQR